MWKVRGWREKPFGREENETNTQKETENLQPQSGEATVSLGHIFHDLDISDHPLFY